MMVTSLRMYTALPRYVTSHVVFPAITLFQMRCRCLAATIIRPTTAVARGVWAPDRLCGLGKPPRPCVMSRHPGRGRHKV